MKAVITLEEHLPAQIEINEDGTKRSIYVDMQELADFIVSSVSPDIYSHEQEAKKEPIVISPSLPPNTVKYAKMSDDSDLLFMFHPQTKANVTYHGTGFKDVPFPNLVFCFGVRNQRFSKKFVAVYKDRFLRDDTELFRFPYPNVYQGGNLCYHTNEKIIDLVQLQTFPYLWMNESFNDHLYSQGYTNLLDKSIREILESSQGKPFDEDMLNPMNITFGAWASNLIN